MTKKVIQIDEEKCVGCGLCTTACQEGVIELIDGKAKIMRKDHCDGLGNCLPVCPTNAISFVSDSTDEHKPTVHEGKMGCGCPSSNIRELKRENNEESCITGVEEQQKYSDVSSKLKQWPVQIKLAPVTAPYFENAHLLIAADCSAYAYGNFHNKFMKNKITLIGCPKLDTTDYTEKLTDILTQNNIKSVTVVRMEVPCCAGIVEAVKNALQKSGKMIPWQIVTISAEGKIVEE